MKKCALVTCKNLDGFITDESYLEEALKSDGWDIQWVQWENSEVNWNEFDCAIIRTTWNYTEDLSLFLKNIKKIEDSSCRLFNDFSIINWNSDKKYLRDLEEQGVSIVPTMWEVYNESFEILKVFETLNVNKIVIKPRVSAGAKNTFLLSKDQVNSDLLKPLLGLEVMIQPYLESVAKEGEFSVFYFNKKLSHAILKKPKQGDFRSQEEFGSDIRLIDLSSEQLQFCENVLSKIEGDHLFARVDFINDQSQKPNLIELELIEPGLYFRYKNKSAETMVKALNEMV